MTTETTDAPPPADTEEDDGDDDGIYFQLCCTCGVEFGVPDEYDTHRRNDGRTFYCPNGHGQSYTDSTASQLAKAKQDLAVVKGWAEKMEAKLEKRKWFGLS